MSNLLFSAISFVHRSLTDTIQLQNLLQCDRQIKLNDVFNIVQGVASSSLDFT